MITHLFLDIGGVILTNGWDHHERKRAAVKFKLDWDDMEYRHHITFEIFEQGKITLKEYLNRVIFYKKRAFTFTQFRQFMFSLSQQYPEMIELIRHLKKNYGLKVVVVSNECRELNAYRIQKYKLNSFVDMFISSCYVHYRKPDTEMYKLALDISQAEAKNVLYIENTPMFVEIAQSLGIQSILHTDYKSTVKKFKNLSFNSFDEVDFME